jgi:sugar lactone lactonase YvrE
VEKLAGGFFNISGGAADADNFYFVDAHSNRVYRWSISSRHLSTVSNAATLSPVNLMMDKAGNVMIVSYIHDDVVYAVDAKGSISTLKPGPVTARPDATFYLPVSDWNLNQESLSRPAAHFISPDGKCALPVGQDFLDGTESWGIKSSPPIRSFGLAKAAVGQTFYETDESANMTWAADVQPDGGLKHFRLFANRGGEGVVSDSAGNVYVAAGQIYVYDHDGKWIGTIDVPERPVQMAFGGPDGKTMFIAARSSLYAVRLRFAGGAVTKTVKK